MFAHEHLILAPVFDSGRLRHLRVGGGRTVVLKHLDGTPIRGFNAGWAPVFVYTGLGCIHLLGLEKEAARATWLVASDGRRLGDKLDDLQPGQRAGLRDAIVSRGKDALTRDCMGFIEPHLLRDLLDLVVDARAAAVPPHVPGPQGSLGMLRTPREMRTHLLFKPGDRTLLLLEGWAAGEAGSCRGIGTLSTARAGIVPVASRHLLTLILAPAGTGPTGPPVEIEIAVNGRFVGQVRLDPRWQGEGADLAFWLAPELVGGEPFEIAFRHLGDFRLDALKLAGGRTIPAQLPEPAELMLQFENIGDNCEFGLVQRHFQADPVGLLRFAGLGDPHQLIRFLNDDFGRFGEPGSLGVKIVGTEYFIVDHVYGLAYHTFRDQLDASAAEVIRENEIKLSYLKRKFREDLEDAEKILIYKRVVTQDLHEVVAVHAALNRYGAVNKLLWVTQADDRHLPGDVEWVGDRLLKGYVRAISLSNAHDFDPEVWLRLCRNACMAFRAAEAM